MRRQEALRAWEASLVARERALAGASGGGGGDGDAAARDAQPRCADDAAAAASGALLAAEEARTADTDAPEAPDGPPGDAPALPARIASRLGVFWRKFHGVGSSPLRPPLLEAAYSALAAGLAILALSALHLVAARARPQRLEQLIAPFGASAVLLFAAPTSPLSQPRNLVCGNMLSALIGIAVQRAFRGALPWLAPGIAVGISVFLMAATKCTHPPAGAMALTALARDVYGAPHSWWFVLMPAASGSGLLLLLALLANNAHPRQKYPQHWW